MKKTIIQKYMKTLPAEINFVSQPIYLNLSAMPIDANAMNRFVLEYICGELDVTEPYNRTIIPIPGLENLVLVYNKYEEQKELKRKDRLLKERNYTLMPLASIPELNLELYSQYIVLRVDEDGNLVSLRDEDNEKFMNYMETF